MGITRAGQGQELSGGCRVIDERLSVHFLRHRAISAFIVVCTSRCAPGICLSHFAFSYNQRITTAEYGSLHKLRETATMATALADWCGTRLIEPSKARKQSGVSISDITVLHRVPSQSLPHTSLIPFVTSFLVLLFPFFFRVEFLF